MVKICHLWDLRRYVEFNKDGCLCLFVSKRNSINSTQRVNKIKTESLTPVASQDVVT